MTKAEIKQYNELPDNLPETKLMTKQIQFVQSLYHKYIENKIVKGYGTQLFEIEQKERWPSGPRVKRHEAMRIILNNLVYLNTSAKEMTAEKAAEKFHSTLSCRKSYQILVDKAYR